MQTVMILCGGESSEHEVSLQSAHSIITYIPKDRYRVIPVGVQKNGEWVSGDPLILNTDNPSTICLAPNLKPVQFERGQLNGVPIDAIFPIIHGTYGEDGCLQGLLQIQHVPYVGSGVLGSAVGMDKDMMKRVLMYDGIRCAKHRVIYTWQDHWPSYAELAAELGAILFVKPCNQGSSVGISKCFNEEDYKKAVAYALEFDTKVLVEEFIDGREIEVSVLGNEIVRSSVPGEIVPGHEFYSYDSKYIDSDSTKLNIPAQLDDKLTRELQHTAERAFRLLELSGLSRIDFFLTADGGIWLNEVNTLPGFTNISMYPKLWEKSGLAYPDLIHELIQLAIDKSRHEQKLRRNRS